MGAPGLVPGAGRVAAITKAPRPAPYFLYRLEWTRALNAREVSCRRLKWPRPSWIRQTFCTFVESRREAAPFRSIGFSPLVSSCRASPCLVLSYLVLASAALVFSCLGFSCLRLLWSPLVVSPVVLSSLVLVPACSLWGLLGSLFGTSGGSFWGLREPSGGLLRGRLGLSWGAPEALLAPPGRLLGPSGRLQSRFLPRSRNSSTVQRFS